MKRWPKLSLKYKFILTLLAFTVVLSSSFGFITATRLASELKNQVISRGVGMDNDLHARFWGPGSATLTQQFNNLISALQTTSIYGPEVIYIDVVRDGVTQLKWTPIHLVEEVGRGSSKPLALPSLRPTHSLMTVERQLPLQATLYSGASYLDITRAWPQTETINLTTGQMKRVPNYVRVGILLTQVEATVRREFLVIAGLTTLYILLGLLVAFWLYKGILGPIEVLTQAVKRFKREQTVRAEVHSGDELQTLAEEFNHMANTIAERDSRLEKINRELRQANRIKSEFLAVMGHELKTPLHGIRGYSQLLLEGVDGPLTAGQREDLASITASSDHLRELIDNILRFSKIESGAERLHPEKLEVRAVITEAIQSVKSLARAKGITIETSAQGLRLRADETKLKQILINLLANAIKYTPAGKVRISAEREGDGVRFAVSDSGIGIASEHLGKIFEPFTQIDSSSTREWSGIGLGLAVVKKYVEMHGGQIWVKSQPGQGSVFSFSLPHALIARPAAKLEEVAALESASR